MITSLKQSSSVFIGMLQPRPLLREIAYCGIVSVTAHLDQLRFRQLYRVRNYIYMHFLAHRPKAKIAYVKIQIQLKHKPTPISVLLNVG